jgi:hypothetical protein
MCTALRSHISELDTPSCCEGKARPFWSSAHELLCDYKHFSILDTAQVDHDITDLVHTHRMHVLDPYVCRDKCAVEIFMCGGGDG